MNKTDNYSTYKLKSFLSKAQESNPRYSLRAFARKLGMHSSTLSLVLKGERSIPRKNIERVISELNLLPNEEALFRDSLIKKSNRLGNITIPEELKNSYLLEDTHYSVLAEWEHYAFLSLIEIKEFSSDKSYIASKLSISEKRVEAIIKNLLEANLISQSESGSYNLVKAPLKTTEDVLSKALRTSHIEGLEIASKKIEKTNIEMRDYSSMTVSINTKQIPEAKKIIREFRQKMSSLLRTGDKDEVYQLAIQLFPLTNNN